MSALASPADLEARLGRDLSAEENARVEALLADAGALIGSYTGRDFAKPPQETVQVLRADNCEVRLPQKPVTEVASVVAVSGMPEVPDLPLLDWSFDGIDLIRIGTGASVINLPEAWWDPGAYPGTYRVTWTYGFAEIPADIVMVACGMALRALTTPTMMGGVRSETIGAYSYQLDAASGGLSVSLAAADRQVLDRYRRRAGVIPLRTA